MAGAVAPETVALAMTGASGMPYGLRLLERLLQAGRTVYVMVSPPARMVLAQESDLQLPSRPGEIRSILSERYGAAPGQLEVFGQEEWTAPVASGSAPARPSLVSSSGSPSCRSCISIASGLWLLSR